MKIIFSISCLLAILFLFPTNAFANCGEPSSLVQLLHNTKSGEEAFAQMNLEQLLMHASRARTVIIPCLKERITSRDAAAFHRLMALEAFTHNQTDRVINEFHAARKMEPGYEIPFDVAPRAHPLRVLYEKAAFSEDGKLEVVYPPVGGYITVGGVRNAPRPSKTPVIIQVFGPFDKVMETRYVQPGESLSIWGRNPMGITAKDLGLKSAWVDPKSWYISTGISLVVTSILYGIAHYNKSKFLDARRVDSTDSDQRLSGYMDRANGFGVASVTTGGLAVIFTGIGIGLHLYEPAGE